MNEDKKNTEEKLKWEAPIITFEEIENTFGGLDSHIFENGIFHIAS